MSFEDMLSNQLEEDSKQGVCVDRDRWNHFRVEKALDQICPICGSAPTIPCEPLTRYEEKIIGQWSHVKREKP